MVDGGRVWLPQGAHKQSRGCVALVLFLNQASEGVLVHLIRPTVEVLLMEIGGATSFSLPSMVSRVCHDAGCPGHVGHSSL